MHGILRSLSVVGLVALNLVTGPILSAAPAELFFNTTFSFPGGAGYGVVQGQPNAGQADALGYDTAIAAPNHWGLGQGRLEQSYGLLNTGVRTGTFKFEYKTALNNYAEANATIVDDPVAANLPNKVLKYTLRNGAVPGSPAYGRVQADLYGNQNWREFFYTVRVFIPSNGLKQLEKLPTLLESAPYYGWVTLGEFWNQTAWDPINPTTNPAPSRVGLGLTKPSAAANTPLRFTVGAEQVKPTGGFQKNWTRTNQTVAVPYDTWFTLEFYLKEGGINQGLIYAAITPDGGAKQMLFNYRVSTKHKSDTANLGYQGVNPMKLYMSKGLIDFIKGENGGNSLGIYWDDWKLWYGTMPNLPGFYNIVDE